MLFFFNDTATTEIYTLSLHDALPILFRHPAALRGPAPLGAGGIRAHPDPPFRGRGRIAGALRGGAPRRAEPAELARTRNLDRKSTRLNSSHANISYAVFCLKKKKTAS